MIEKGMLEKARDIMGNAFTVEPTTFGIRITPNDEKRHGEPINEGEQEKLNAVRKAIGDAFEMKLGKKTGVQ